MNNEKFCGECCWFYAEDTYGYGGCPFQFAEVRQCSEKCNTTLKYVSKAQMRHHQAVLLQFHRSNQSPEYYVRPSLKEVTDAITFAYQYIKVFSNL